MKIAGAASMPPLEVLSGPRPPWLEAAASAWRSLGGRQWLLAAGLGAFYALLIVSVNVLGLLGHRAPSAWAGIVAVHLTRWLTLMSVVACALAFAAAVLRDLARRIAIGSRHIAVAICGVMAVALTVDPLTVYLARAVHDMLHVQTVFFTTGSPGWMSTVSRGWALAMDQVFRFVAVATLSVVSILKTARTSEALANAQLQLSETQRRSVLEELRSTQAGLDPTLLFETLAEVDARFEREPQVAQRLLDALIRYLRAALPETDQGIGTLRQQAALLRAYLDIASIRSGGRVDGDIAWSQEVASRLFAPALLFPLVTLACAGASSAAPGAEVRVRVAGWLRGGRLVVEVSEGHRAEAPGGADEAALAALRQRVRVLYGQRAELSFAVFAPRGSVATITIDDPGSQAR